MKYVFNAILVIVVIIVIRMAACNNKQQTTNNVTAPVSQTENFSGARILKTCKNYFNNPESVTFDKDNEVIYISNTEDSVTDNESTGYICKASLYGEIIDTLKITNLVSPKGMAVKDGILYISDVNKIIKYNTEKEWVEKCYDIPEAQSLKDIEISNSGIVYISDSKADKVYKIEADSVNIFCADSLCKNIKALCLDNDELIGGAQNQIIKFKDSGKAIPIAKLKFTPEALKSDGRGNYLISDIYGGIYAVGKDTTEMLVEKHKKINCGDFEYNTEQNLLFLPTITDNSLEIYELGKYLIPKEN